MENIKEGKFTLPNENELPHTLVVGGSEEEKEKEVFKPLLKQLLQSKQDGEELSVSVISPNGTISKTLDQSSKEMGITYNHISLSKEETSEKYNVLNGESEEASDTLTAVLRYLSNDDTFFNSIRETVTKNTVRLIKEINNDADIADLYMVTKFPNKLKKKVNELKELKGNTELVDFFETKFFGSSSKHYLVALDTLKNQLEIFVSKNKKIEEITTSCSTFSINEHVTNKGVLSVNTANEETKKLGSLFGQLFMMNLQNEFFDNRSNVKHYLIIDEVSNYIHSKIDLLISVARVYNVFCILTTKNVEDLKVETNEFNTDYIIKNTFLTNCNIYHLNN